jgi:uncharacterized protein
MDLSNEFTVGLPIDRAWALLTDIERIAPCMPGAQLTGAEGDVYSGVVKVKLGPVTAQYAGTATFEHKDDAARAAVLRASGRDSHGQGTASALITATLEAHGDHTLVLVHTDLTITGKVAQFGRGVILEVSAKLLDQFVQCLESSLVAELPTMVPDAVATASSAPPLGLRGEPREVMPLDLAAVARGAVLKRAVPVAVVLAVVVGVIVWLARR